MVIQSESTFSPKVAFFVFVHKGEKLHFAGDESHRPRKSSLIETLEFLAEQTRYGISEEDLDYVSIPDPLLVGLPVLSNSFVILFSVVTF